MSTKTRKAKVKNTETGKFITVDLPVGMYLKTDKKTGKDFLQVAYKDGEDVKRQRVAMTLEAYKNAANMLNEERAYIKRFEAAHGKDYKLLDADERAGLDEYRKVQFELAGLKEISLLAIVKDWVKRNVPKINLTYADLVAEYNEQKQRENLENSHAAKSGQDYNQRPQSAPSVFVYKEFYLLVECHHTII